MTAISVSERLLEMAAFYTWLDFTLTKEQPEEVDARLMACVRFLRRRSPAGLRCLVCNLAVLLFSLCVRYFLHVRGKGGITTLGVLYMSSKRPMPACQND